MSRNRLAIKIVILACALLVTVNCINFPVSMAVVRNVVPPLTVSNYLSKIGCCQFDSNGQLNGYTILSLDGFKSSSTTASLQTGISPLSQWINAFSVISASKTSYGGNSSNSVQFYLLEELHRNGVTLLINALADEAPISQQKVAASSVANNIISVVRSAQFDGVSIEFSDFQAVAQGTASAWLQQLLLMLRPALQGKEIVLIIPVSMVQRVALFQQPIVSALVDLFVLKYFGFNQEDYTSYNTLFLSSNAIANTAFRQLLKSKTVGIDLCRTAIAKPANFRVNSYVSAATLGAAFSRARTQLGWFGGYANLDYESDTSKDYQLQVLATLRRDCLSKGDCYCG